MDSLPQIIGAVLAYLLATLVRIASKQRFWKRVEAKAERYLNDPSLPDDPRRVAELALADEQHESVQRVAKSIERRKVIAADRPFEKHARRQGGDYQIVKDRDSFDAKTPPHGTTYHKGKTK